MKKNKLKKLIKKEVEKQLGIYIVVEPFYCDVIVGEEGYKCEKQCEMCKDIIKKKKQ
tara:strand:+ start:868 stop:1038 length:171 start_codon:yes stop_codon:yes gene_type:complete